MAYGIEVCDKDSHCEKIDVPTYTANNLHEDNENCFIDLKICYANKENSYICYKQYNECYSSAQKHVQDSLIETEKVLEWGMVILVLIFVYIVYTLFRDIY